MHRCFSTAISPILVATQARTIVEVGSGEGRLSRRLLQATSGALDTLHAIDPSPGADLIEMATRHKQITLHRACGVDVLTEIGPVDIAVLDGDPNWYTVHQEITALAAVAREASEPAPIVLVHHAHWPFGRRDGYHAPDRIPAHHRQPHVAAGLDLALTTPTDDGLRLTPFVAVSEFGDRNGVMTAVDDFITGDGDAWHVVEIPGYHGVAILVSAARLEAPEIRALIEILENAATIKRIARRVEAGRIEALTAQQTIKSVGDRRAEDDDRIREDLAAQLNAADAERQATKAALAEAQQSAERLRREDAERTAALHEALARSRDAVDQATAQIAELARAKADADGKLIVARHMIEITDRHVHQLGEQVANHRAVVVERDEQFRRATELAIQHERAAAEAAVLQTRLETTQRSAESLLLELEAEREIATDLQAEVRDQRGRITHLEEVLEAARRDIDVHSTMVTEMASAADEATELISRAAESHALRATRRLRRFFRLSAGVSENLEMAQIRLRPDAPTPVTSPQSHTLSVERAPVRK